MIVTRQSNYYDEGAYSVEVARELDVSGPGALVAKYGDEFLESDDPREIAEAAIRIRSQWHADGGRQDESGAVLRFTIAMNDLVYATVNDGLSASQLRRWARKRYEALPKCDYCGEICEAEDNWTSYDLGDCVTACCESHADELFSRFYVDEEEGE